MIAGTAPEVFDAEITAREGMRPPSGDTGLSIRAHASGSLESRVDGTRAATLTRGLSGSFHP